MNDLESTGDGTHGISRDETLSALFAYLVLQQTNMALMLLGKAPHPETGERSFDAAGAQFFIDLLEMLEVKTRGNLDPREQHLLRQSLTTLRMAFVEAVDEKPSSAPPPAAGGQAQTPLPEAGAATGTGSLFEAAPAPDESRKKFTKKY